MTTSEDNTDGSTTADHDDSTAVDESDSTEIDESHSTAVDESDSTEIDESDSTATDDGLLTNYLLYVIIGSLMTVIAWTVIPLVGAVAAYAGYRLYSDESKLFSGGFFMLAGVIPVVLWIGVLVQVA